MRVPAPLAHEMRDILVRCEIDTLAPGERWRLYWEADREDPLKLHVTATAVSNEAEADGETNVSTDTVGNEADGSNSSFGWILIPLALLAFVRRRSVARR